jgi:hypothetical protein
MAGGGGAAMGARWKGGGTGCLVRSGCCPCVSSVLLVREACCGEGEQQPEEGEETKRKQGKEKKKGKNMEKILNLIFF